MNQKEISELRRRLRPDRQNITHIRGCYVSDNGEIISQFDLPLGLMPEDEKEKYLALFKRVLSGGLGKNLMDISFRTSQVADSAEHRLLTALKDSALKDDETLAQFYGNVIEALSMDTNYVILLAQDTYDVPGKRSDGALDADGSESVFTYVLCAVCPVKMRKPALTYVADESVFHNRGTDFLISPPELGFLFPAFDDRATNLYNALFYTHNVRESHQSFVDAIFRVEAPMPAAEQKETFEALLGSTLEEECSYAVVQSVQDALLTRIEAHKEARDPEMLTISREDVAEVLENCGVSESRRAAFDVKFDAAFGTDADLTPRNLVDTAHMEVKTPDVVIRVNPARSDLIETRVIGGSKYILVRAEETVEVNGVDIHIEKDT